MRYGLIVLLVLCFAGAANCQPVYFRHYQVEDGLPNNTVFSVFQDSRGFMWFGTKEGLCRFDGSAFRAFNMPQGDREFVYCLAEGIHHTLWTGTRKGLYEFDPRTETFTALATAKHGEVLDVITGSQGKVWFMADLQLHCYDERTLKTKSYQSNISAISQGKDSSIWASSIDGTLFRYNAANDSFHCMNPDQHQVAGVVNRIYCTPSGAVLVGTIRGLFLFDPVIGDYRPLLGQPLQEKPVYVRDILHYAADEYWIASESGIQSINLKTGIIKVLQQKDADPYSLSDNAAYTLFRDREDGIWCGTYFGGVNYYHNRHSYFHKYFRDDSQQSLSGKAVREICADNWGNLWIGTEDAGLNKLDPRTGKVTRHPVSSTNIHALLADGNELWVGTFQQGLDVLDLRTGKRLRHYNADPRQNGLPSNFIISACKTKKGEILLGTSQGVYRYDRASQRFGPAPGFPEHIYVFSLYEDRAGCLWAGTIGNGLYSYQPGTGAKGNLRYNPNDSHGISSNSVCGVFEDSRRQLWISTEGGGLCRLDSTRQYLRRFNTNSGLPGNMIYKVLEDHAKRLWVSTSRGLAMHDPETDSWKVYTKSHGLLTDQFNYNSGYCDSTGVLYFGSVKGLISFQPGDMLPEKDNPPVYITSLQVNNQELAADNDKLRYSVTFTDTVYLNYDQSSFVIGFAALTYISADMTQYAYRLDGLDKSWNYLPANRKVYFTDLSPGDYLFRVKAANSAETRLLIRIMPPWWLSLPAYLAYGVLTMLLIYTLIHAYHRRQRIRHQRKLAIFEQQKEKEIYKAKIEFFTNVAHEIRTPLTLIKGPLEMVIDEVGENPAVKKSLQNIERNTERLVALTGQLLDFRKTEHQDFSLSFVEADVPHLVQENYLAFSAMAQQKLISFDIDLPAQSFKAFIDVEAFHKIISNLISNALKYADARALIKVEPPDEQGNFRIEVRNDGPLIPWQLREKIFEPFFRLQAMEQPGSGIGLPLARALAQLHSGTLQLCQTDGRMNIFELVLPVHQQIEFKLGSAQEQST